MFPKVTVERVSHATPLEARRIFQSVLAPARGVVVQCAFALFVELAAKRPLPSPFVHTARTWLLLTA